ncbi:YqaE/Pmp3 family membrane protein [Bacillus stercoris]|uniref:YqaE/Pmp3 family membrane protein n=1 Tax=Bacillus TaxID=1386 RepID=UPI00069333C8|nr:MULTISPECIES: YqaE/Pmp3 family membrane protein [Bacillus]ASB60393.1 YqaE/Pmp3 family membrane protein [Bacillus sp. MD-5]MDL9995349.1 YqaE/Pmp3 family membrane protein [Bacillus stercoris]TII15025.1 YqaE/Pmp3 family membrane protein [Bacillus subtilis]BEV38263.1 YqaE/Pmp3 family membrane protein [Bacillus stercoris]
MMYLLAVLCPPLAVLFSGKPFQALLNLILTCIFWLPGAIHACFIVADRRAEKRVRR